MASLDMLAIIKNTPNGAFRIIRQSGFDGEVEEICDCRNYIKACELARRLKQTDELEEQHYIEFRYFVCAGVQFMKRI